MHAERSLLGFFGRRGMAPGGRLGAAAAAAPPSAASRPSAWTLRWSGAVKGLAGTLLCPWLAGGRSPRPRGAWRPAPGRRPSSWPSGGQAPARGTRPRPARAPPRAQRPAGRGGARPRVRRAQVRRAQAGKRAPQRRVVPGLQRAATVAARAEMQGRSERWGLLACRAWDVRAWCRPRLVSVHARQAAPLLPCCGRKRTTGRRYVIGCAGARCQLAPAAGSGLRAAASRCHQ